MKHDVSNNRNGYKIEMKEIKYNSTSQKSINSLMKKMTRLIFGKWYCWKMVKSVMKITSTSCLKLKYNAH